MMVTATAKSGDTAEMLCGLLLEFVGRSAGRMLTARRHVIALDRALPYMTKAQQAEARSRIKHLETRWGPMLPGEQNDPENGGILPEMRVAHWLSKRRVPERHLRVLYRAAQEVAEGETSITTIMDHAFARETDHVLIPVGLDSFKEWMIELRIATRVAKGIYGPGSLCRWWVAEMAPSRERSSAYRRCLDLSDRIRHPKWTGGR